VLSRLQFVVAEQVEQPSVVDIEQPRVVAWEVEGEVEQSFVVGEGVERPGTVAGEVEPSLVVEREAEQSRVVAGAVEQPGVVVGEVVQPHFVTGAVEQPRASSTWSSVRPCCSTENFVAEVVAACQDWMESWRCRHDQDIEVARQAAKSLRVFPMKTGLLLCWPCSHQQAGWGSPGPPKGGGAG